MKKWMSVMLACVLAVCLTACSTTGKLPEPDEAICKADIQEYIKEILDDTAQVVSVEKISGESENGSYVVSYDVAYSGETGNAIGTFTLTYNENFKEWELEKCRVVLQDTPDQETLIPGQDAASLIIMQQAGAYTEEELKQMLEAAGEGLVPEGILPAVTEPETTEPETTEPETTEPETTVPETTAPPIVIVKQPVDSSAPKGKSAVVTIEVVGEGLTYEWWAKDIGDTKFYKSPTFVGEEYLVAMDEIRNGRQVYCVITDMYNNTISTKTATLTMEPAQ